MFLEDKANGESLDGFIEFLGTKSRDERYVWPQAAICACGQYAASLGKKEWIGTGEVWSKLNRIALGGDPDFDHRCVDNSSKWTFGQCLDRARQVQTQEVKKVKEAA